MEIIYKYRMNKKLIKGRFTMDSEHVSTSKSSIFREYRIHTNRVDFAVIERGNPAGFPVICLHGWLDNAATFEHLVPKLDLERNRYIAVDFPGHGYSSHRPPGDIYHLIEYVIDCEALVREMGFKQFDVLGHSLGGVIGAMWAASTCQVVRSLVLIDSLGPYTGVDKKIASGLKEAMSKIFDSKVHKPIYKTIGDAVTARMSGIGNLSYNASEVLVKRGLTEVSDGYTWRTDSRLTHPSLIRFNENQVEAFLSTLSAPTYCILASNGLIAKNGQSIERLKYFKNVIHSVVEGGHHLHLDDAPDAVAEKINTYYQNNLPQLESN